MDREDVLSYSLCCKEFNAESMRLVWSVFDLPGPEYRGTRGTYKDACQALLRVPARGKRVKCVTFLCTIRQCGVAWNVGYLDILEQVLMLMPNVQSISMLRTTSIPIPGLIGPGPDILSRRVYATALAWAKENRLKRYKSVYKPLDEVLPFLKCCAEITHLSVQLPPLGDPTLLKSTIVSSSLEKLSSLSHLEGDFQTLPFFLSLSRNIVDVRILPAACDVTIEHLIAIGDALREANTVQVLQFTNIPLDVAGCMVSHLGSLDSLRVAVERNQRSFDELHHGEYWAHELLSTLEQMPSLETYILRGESNFHNDEVQTSGSRTSDGFTTSLVNFFGRHIPPSRFPSFHHLAILEKEKRDGSKSNYRCIERGVDGMWCVPTDDRTNYDWILEM